MKEGRSKAYLKGTRRHQWTGKIPMEKLLRSHVGKNWDKIYQDFSKEFKHGTRAGDLFYNCLEWKVSTKCWKGAETGTIYDSKGTEVFGFYVHPLSNCLEFKPDPIRKKVSKPLTEISLADGTKFEKLDGIWYHTKYKEGLYGPEREYKRQLNAHELKAANLHNDSLEDQLKAKEERKKREKQLYLLGQF